jgi:hypothetical protein
LPITPCPTPLPSAIREEGAVEAQRNLFCFHYDRCLHEAVKRAWDGWTCRHCPLRDWRTGAPEASDYAHARPKSQDGN